MSMPAAFPSAPRGIAFEIGEHVAIRSWAEACGLRLTTEIDHVVAGQEYEEVLAVYEAGDTWRRLVFWRASGAVVLEPRLGPAQRFGGVWDAIEAAAELICAPVEPGPMRTPRPAARTRAPRRRAN